MPVDRLLPSEDAQDLIALTRQVADKLLDPIVDAHERSDTYPGGRLQGARSGRPFEPPPA